MKKKLLLISSLILNCTLVILLAFRNSGKDSQTSQHHFPVVNLTSHRDSLTTVLANVKRFVTVFDSTDHDILRAFTISGHDMLQVMGADTTVMKQCVYDSCRAYLGYDINHHFKLYLTPVKNQRDVFLNFDLRKRVNNVPDKSSYVLDLIAPCPNTCDTASALYTFKMPNR
ncbi:hypothetical protein [Fluviicola sp.]|jgi:hypothetical protein|uniref:hypothetical protein n=1 Tax=Fluviicola sp. TaxID=1917219 RepID=UPI002623CD25|nr:hypothetical protein [Fluviicola sp.]